MERGKYNSKWARYIRSEGLGTRVRNEEKGRNKIPETEPAIFSMVQNVFFQAEDGIRDRSPSRGLGDVYKRQFIEYL